MTLSAEAIDASARKTDAGFRKGELVTELVSEHDIQGLARTLENDVIAWRRHFHRHPELSFQETETANFVEETLRSFEGLEITRPTDTSVMARLAGAGPGRTVALRADIDALPISEENTFDFASVRPGVMHACGHDGHTAMLLGVAQIMSRLREKFVGEARFVFQHAEELPPGGARDLVLAGVMDGVDAVIGCHLISMLESGKVAVITGPAMAAADFFSIAIRGTGGHAAFPHETVDPVAVAAQVITNLQHVISRQTDPQESAVVSIAKISGGTADNVIPETVEMSGTMRTFSLEMRERTREAVERVVRGVTEAHGSTFDMDYKIGYDPVVNDEPVAAIVASSARDEVGVDGVVDIPPLLGGDDFSAYLGKAPGTYFFVGTRNETVGSTFPHHHPRFTLDEASLPIGIRVFVRSTLQLLSSPS